MSGQTLPDGRGRRPWAAPAGPSGARVSARQLRPLQAR